MIGNPENFTISRIESPIGALLLATAPDGKLCMLDFHNDENSLRHSLARHYGQVHVAFGTAPASAQEVFARYFDGETGALAVVPWRLHGTEFQKKVWSALPAIPPGQTTSYGALAAKIDAPKAVRAVGRAVGANPIALVLPCHRVVGADGSLTGFGGGLPRKRWLLRHERASFKDSGEP